MRGEAFFRWPNNTTQKQQRKARREVGGSQNWVDRVEGFGRPGCVEGAGTVFY